MRKKAVITGGAGFIGSHLTDELLENGYQVRVLDNLRNGKLENLENHKKNKNFEFIKGSILKKADLKKALKNVDVVFHLACLGVRHSLLNPVENHEVNAGGTLLTLETARESGVQKFIYCSSSEIYGTAIHVPMKESHPANPHTVYGAGKLAGEHYSRAYADKMSVTIIRPFNAYGPRSHHEGDCGEVIPKSIVRALNNESILVFGDGKQTRDFTFVRDTARGLRLTAEKETKSGDIFNLGYGSEIKILDLAKKIQKISGFSVKIEHTSPRPQDVLRLYADASKFQKIFNWRPDVDFETGLQQTYDFFRKHPLGIQKLLKQEIAKVWEK